MTKAQRQEIHSKYGGRCAYCGKVIAYKDMQVDHVFPKHMCIGTHESKLTDMENLFPTCRRCNYYKGGNVLEGFRSILGTLHERVRKQYICKVAEDYGIIKVEPWDGVFYFEKQEGDE